MFNWALGERVRKAPICEVFGILEIPLIKMFENWNFSFKDNSNIFLVEFKENMLIRTPICHIYEIINISWIDMFWNKVFFPIGKSYNYGNNGLQLW